MIDPTAGVLGQGDELRELGRFLDEVQNGPTAVVINGDIGAGKTTLLRAAVVGARTRRYRVLACHPSESEASLTFAALGDLLDGVVDELQADIPSPQLRALRIAVLLDDPQGPLPDLRAVAVGTLGILRTLARISPVVIALDDHQWLDPATARVLRFIARRLEVEPVGWVIAGRDGEGEGDSILREADLPEQRTRRLRPAPLDADAFDSLFRNQLGQSFPRPLLRQIAGGSGGNPLFGLEIARGILRGDIRPQPGQRLPVPHELDDLVGARLSGLPADARELLWHAAAVSEPTVALIEAAAAVGDPLVGLDEAVRAGVIEVEGGRVRFTHPLFASTLYHAAPPERRRLLHRRLAQLATGPFERARHLALSATQRDPDVAAALAEAAQDAAARGAPDAAAIFSERAWRLTPVLDRDTRHRRRIQGAEYHFASGDTGRARAILEESLATLEPGPLRADLLRRLAKVRYRTDSASIAAELLTRALHEAESDPALQAAIERDLAWAVTLCGDVRDASEHAKAALALVRQTGDKALLPEVLAANGMADFLAGGGLPFELMRRAVKLAQPGSEVPIEWRPEMMLAVMLKWSGALREARAKLAALQHRATEAGDETSLPYLLAQLSETETWLGDWDAALEHAVQGDRLALQTGQEPIRANVFYAKSLVLAHRGEVDEARASARDAFDLSAKSGSVISMMQSQSVLGFLDLSLDDPAGADDRLRPLEAWLEVVGIREPGVLRFVPDQVEALIGLGRLEKAEELLGPFEADAARLGRGWAMLASARVRALHMAAASDSAAATLVLRRALDAFGDDHQPFARARALLALGTIERRTRRRSAARASLHAALEAFDALGARLWAAKAQRMLGGSNGTDKGEASQLTPAEERVAELVASGATNRAVADRLFVSVRAVEAHLTSIYRKLGIRSRSRLAALMARRNSPGLHEQPSRSTGALQGGRNRGAP